MADNDNGKLNILTIVNSHLQTQIPVIDAMSDDELTTHIKKIATEHNYACSIADKRSILKVQGERDPNTGMLITPAHLKEPRKPKAKKPKAAKKPQTPQERMIGAFVQMGMSPKEAEQRAAELAAKGQAK